MPTIPGTRDYEWILCLPILTSPDGAAIGVFGFAGTRDHNTEATNQLAGGLQASADWLRDADLDGLKSGVERQVKEHPGRSLAVAVGLGYLLGKAFRK